MPRKTSYVNSSRSGSAAVHVRRGLPATPTEPFGGVRSAGLDGGRFAASSLLIVTTAVASAKAAPTGSPSPIVNASFASMATSPTTGTAIVAAVSPGAKVSSPARGR